MRAKGRHTDKQKQRHASSIVSLYRTKGLSPLLAGFNSMPLQKIGIRCRRVNEMVIFKHRYSATASVYKLGRSLNQAIRFKSIDERAIAALGIKMLPIV